MVTVASSSKSINQLINVGRLMWKQRKFLSFMMAAMAAMAKLIVGEFQRSPEEIFSHTRPRSSRDPAEIQPKPELRPMLSRVEVNAESS